MNPTAIYSKSGKGVQEAAGKTSLLSRPDRAVLAAIDGRATLQDVAAKVGKPFDPTFEQIITKLDTDGFIREVSAGTMAPAAKPAGKAPGKPKAKAAEPSDPDSDLDFSMLGASSMPAPPAAKAPAPAKPPARAKPSVPPPPPSPPPKEQESALFKARVEAEARAQAEKDRQRKAAEEKVRAEVEAKARAEAEAKARTEAEAKIKAAREAAMKAAAEAKAKADAEAKRAREEAERAKKEAEERERRVREEAERAKKEAEERERRAREEAERLRKEAEERERRAREEVERIRREAEEKARREQEELRKRLEVERKAREEAERKAREGAERKAREEAERKAREEAERKAREEAERVRREAKADADRVRRQAEEEAERARQQLEEERRALEEERHRREDEERREEERRAAQKAAKSKPEAEKEQAPAPKAAGGFADSLMADLDSFNTQEDEETKAREETERKAQEEAVRRAREAEERRAMEEAGRAQREAKQRAKEEKERKKREEEERLRREEEGEKERIRREEEKREREAEERARKAKAEEVLARQASSTSVGYASEDKRRKRQLELGRRDPSLARRKETKWGKAAAVTLLFVLLAALAVAHVIPISMAEYERAASEALGRPVRTGGARLWLLSGLELRIDGASVGDLKVARVIARPSIFSLTGTRKSFSSIELHGVSLPQDALGAVLFTRLKGDLFEVKQVLVRQLELPGQLPLPGNLDADVIFRTDGTVLSAVARGPERFVARLEPKGGDQVAFQVDAGSFRVPFAPGVTLSAFGMKGVATKQGAQISEWGGALLDGNVSGTARVRWGGTWTVDGVLTARGINAAVFAPALLSEGRAEGTGKFSMVGPEPAKLGANGRVEGNFTVSKGVLGSIDLSRAIQTSGRQAQGRTQFAEMNGQAIYDRGEVELRNVTIGAGALNAGATAAIDGKGALSGRIVADIRTASQTLRATLLLGGTVKEPQVRN